MFKPLIGITLDYEKDNTAYSKYPYFAIRENYASAVTATGGIPIMLPYDRTGIEKYTKLLDGLIITGGDFDIPPGYYGESTKHDRVTIKDERTQFESSIAKSMLNSDKPILGICGGAQLLNVIFSGSLIQHIPDFINSEIQHEQKKPPHFTTHEIIFSMPSKLYDIVQNERMEVNSTHHQAVLNPGEGMKVSATAKDGIIEAIEHTGFKFCFGVQWHPEYFNTIEDKKIISSFIAHCGS